MSNYSQGNTSIGFTIRGTKQYIRALELVKKDKDSFQLDYHTAGRNAVVVWVFGKEQERIDTIEKWVRTGRGVLIV